MPAIDTIDGCGFPLGFRFTKGAQPPSLLGLHPGREVYTVEARKMSASHQKEAVVREGEQGSQWRMVSDEGGHLKGTDLAPFPLGFFNAGLQADLAGRIMALSEARGIAIDELSMTLKNGYYMTGSFFRGDGEGFAEPAETTVHVRSNAAADDVRALVSDAVDASPALAAMRKPLVNRFAVYANGRRRTLTRMLATNEGSAADPFSTYSQPPAPPAGETPVTDLIRKTGEEESGSIEPAPAGTSTRIIRTVHGNCRLVNGAVTETDTWLALPGMSHFALQSDEHPGSGKAPSGLALLSAGIAFCFMTQLDRYIEHMKFDIHGVRLVQRSPYSLTRNGDSLNADVEPVHTHLFLNGREDEDTYETLMHIAARTCYLHATLASSLDPVVGLVLNGTPID